MYYVSSQSSSTSVLTTTILNLLKHKAKGGMDNMFKQAAAILVLPVL